MKLMHKPLICLVEVGPGVATEKEFHTFVPKDAFVVTTRAPYFEITQRGLEQMVKNIPVALDSVLVVGSPCKIIVICSMTGTCIKGAEITNSVQQQRGIPVLTAAYETARILNQKKWHNVAFVSPFNEELNFIEKVFFSNRNINISKIIRIFDPEPDQAAMVAYINPEYVLKKVKEADFGNVDAVVFDSPTFHLIDIWSEIKQVIPMPILSVNQILLYATLKNIGLPTSDLLISEYLD